MMNRGAVFAREAHRSVAATIVTDSSKQAPGDARNLPSPFPPQGGSMSAKSRFFWHDLMTRDVEQAKAFYGELFGWSFKAESGPNPYTHVMSGQTGIGGLLSLDQMEGG